MAQSDVGDSPPVDTRDGSMRVEPVPSFDEPQASTAHNHRPRGVVAAAVVAIVAGVAAIVASLTVWAVGGIFTMAVGQENAIAALGAAYLVFAATETAVGIGLIVFAFGALKLRRWAWTLGLVLIGIGMVLGIPALFVENTTLSDFGAPLLGIPVLVALLVLLLWRPVRSALGHPGAERPSGAIPA